MSVFLERYSEVLMSAMASQITGVSIFCSTFCSGAHQWKHQSSASRAFVRGIHRWPVDSPHRGPVTRKMFIFDGVIMNWIKAVPEGDNLVPNVATLNRVYLILSRTPVSTTHDAFLSVFMMPWRRVTWKHFLHYWPFVRVIHWWSVDSPS